MALYEAAESSDRDPASPSPSPSDLVEAINELVRKDAELNELNETIGEMLEGDEFEFDYSDTLLYQGRICRAVSRLQLTLNDLKAHGMRQNSTSGKSLSVSPFEYYNCSKRRAQDRVPFTATYDTRECFSSWREQEKTIENNTLSNSSANFSEVAGKDQSIVEGQAEPPHNTDDEAEHEDMPAGCSNKVASNVRNDKLMEQAGTSVADQDDSAEAVQADGEDISSTVELEEMQTASVELEVVRAPDETRI